MSLFQAEALTDPLTENEGLDFVAIALQPPLAEFGFSFDRATFFPEE